MLNNEFKIIRHSVETPVLLTKGKNGMWIPSDLENKLLSRETVYSIINGLVEYTKEIKDEEVSIINKTKSIIIGG